MKTKMSKPAKTKRKGTAVTFWMDDDIHAAMRKFLASQPLKPAMRAVVNLAVRRFLESEGVLTQKE